MAPLPSTETPKILLVDDRLENLKILEKSLRGCNADCIAAQSGNEALKAVLVHDFALAILDVQMPEMDGYELAHLLRSNENTQNLPIIFLSAVYSDDFHIFKGYESGGIDFISKPYEPKLLQSKVEIFLSLYKHRKEIELSKELYAKTFNAITDTVMVLDHDMRVMRINHSGCHLLGLQEQDIIGHFCYELFADRSTPCETCKRTEQLDGNITAASWEMEHAKLKKSCRVSISPLYPPPAKSNMAVYFVQDITNQKRLQERLLQVEKLEAIGSLAGGIAHDFNNILAVILGNAELGLLDNGLSEGVEKKLHQIHDASKRAKELVAQILTYSRKSQFNPRPILLQPVLKEAHKLLRSTLPQSVRLIRNISRTEAKVLAAPLQIHQVVMNLCTNSFHALGGEKGVIEINLRKVKPEPGLTLPKNSTCLHLQVKDSGIGMDFELQNKIFEPFFTTKPEGLGTGMGLAIAKKIITECEGEITVSSIPGKGTSFDIYLPITSQSSREDEAADVSKLPRGSGLVLVVDDEHMIRSVLKNTLEYLGYNAVTACSAQQALTLFRDDSAKFAAVLTDQEMPGTSGEELVPQLLAIRNDIPVILSTGHSARMNADKAHLLGARDYLIKPIGINTLAESLKKILSY